MAEDSSHKNGDSTSNSNAHANSDEPWNRRFGKWIAGVVAAVVASVIAAIIIPYATSVGNHVTESLNTPGQPGGPPVKINLVTEYPADGETRAILTPLALSESQLASLNSLDVNSPTYHSWFTSHGAVAVNVVSIELVVQGNRNNSVRVVNMQPVVSCRAPLTGTLFFSPPAGAEMTTRLALNLDRPFIPPGYYAGATDQVTPNYFEHYTVSLKRGEQFIFYADAFTVAHYCEFKLEMTVLDGSRTLPETISDNGQPFRVTAGVYKQNNNGLHRFARYQDLYVWGLDNRTVWVRANPANLRF